MHAKMKKIFSCSKSLNPRFIRNRFLLNRDYLRRKVVVSGYPSELTIELTNYCNYNCVFCPHENMKRPIGFIDFELFKCIVDQVKEYLEAIDLDLLGESALHPRIFDVIDYCRRAGIKTILNSNMAATDAKLSKELIRAGLDMLIMGIDGATKQTYESLRRGACFETTKKNIEMMLSLDNSRLFKVVQMVYNIRNKHEAGDFLKMWKNKGADYIRLRPYENKDKQLLELNAIPVNSRSNSGKPCMQIWRKFAICWDGTAVLCCGDYDKFSVIGDVNRDTVEDIWNGPRMTALRKKHASGDLEDVPFCRECRSFKPGLLLILGSTFVDPYNMRRLLFMFEKLLIQKNIIFFRYF